VNYDMAKPFNIYGGMQDNGVWKGSSENELSDRWHSTGEYGFKSYIGGDGMQVAIDNRDNQTVYTGYQFGNYFRINQKNGDYEFISPTHELGERPLRFNWQSPVALSTFNQDILYFGANKLYRSMNQGKTWTAISDDLTNGGKPGNVPYGTLTTFHESPLKFGQIVTGSDDGKINLTRDGGYTWIDISKGLPAILWVSRVQFSAFSLSRIYISLNGYRNDYFESHVYMSDDYGNNWTRIGTTLPAEPINVIKEDPQNEDILYVGTDHGLYVSLDRGKSFMGMNHSLPGVSIHDLFVHPRDHKLVIGTHGRSIYITDVANVQQLNNENLAKELMVFPINTIQADAWGKKFSAWDAPKSPEIEISFYSKEPGLSNISITDEDKNVLFSTSINAIKGLNKFVYNGTVDEKIIPKYTNTLLKAARKENPEAEIMLNKADDGKYYIQSGKYTATIKRNNHIAETEMEIE
ncbi:MAG TPA: glycosyl hydrolase, partial [Saprospiraceae bacterium]|nr:glycosyl hydrolase [Saprospiraceae bacterium]